MRNQSKPRKVPVARAIAIGLLWVNGPIAPIMCGIPALTWFVMYSVLGGPEGIGVLAGIAFIVSLPTGFALAWLWWSLTVPKWRLWAYVRVDDIGALKEQAVAAGLTWPDGSVFERTEIKTKGHAEQERELERAKGS